MDSHIKLDDRSDTSKTIQELFDELNQNPSLQTSPGLSHEIKPVMEEILQRNMQTPL